MSGNGRNPAVPPGREAPALPKRFFKDASVAASGDAFRILLDGRPVRTPRKSELAVPTRSLAEAVAAEWAAQGERIDPASMPLTRLVNSVLDGVIGREAEVRDDIVKYAGSDLLCYRAGEPAGLTELQARHWDPILDWSRAALGAEFTLAQGLMPVAQRPEAVGRIAEELADLDAFRLGALHLMTTLMGSALLAIAVLKGRLDADAAWEAAHVDEDWQIRQWGEDAEAAARRSNRRRDMDAADRLLALIKAP